MRVFFILTDVFGSWQMLPSIKAVDRYNVEECWYSQGVDVERLAREYAPHVIVYCAITGGPHRLTTDHLRQLRRVAPVVVCIPEASDYKWWGDYLKQIRDTSAADLVVNIDGNDNWPGAQYGLTTLSPNDPGEWGSPLPFRERDIVCGAGGAMYGPRPQILAKAGNAVSFRVANGRDMDSYRGYISFLKHCKFALNFSHKGSGEGGAHVKGRVIDAAYAGCVLLEPAGSPTSRWFVPGVEYIEYNSPTELPKAFEMTEAQWRDMATRFRNKVMGRFTPDKFWPLVFSKLHVSAMAGS